MVHSVNPGVLAALAAVAGLAIYLWTRSWARHQRRRVERAGLKSAKDRAALELVIEDIVWKRGGVAAALLGAFVAFYGSMELRQRELIRLGLDDKRMSGETLSRQVDRQSTAVRALESELATTRLSGLLTLRRIGVSDAAHRGDCVDLLCSFVRDRRSLRNAAGELISRHPITHDEAVALRALCAVTALAREDEAIVANLSETDLAGADLKQCILRRANLRGARLEETNLTGSDLVRADLRGCFGRDIGFYGCDLTSARFSGARMTRPRFAGATLQRATFFELAEPRQTYADAAATTQQVLAATAVIKTGFFDEAFGVDAVQLEHMCFDVDTRVPAALVGAAVEQRLSKAAFCQYVDPSLEGGGPSVAPP